MALPVPNLESYNQQIGAIQSQLAQLRQPQTIQPMAPLQIPSQIKYVDGLSGAKEYQSRMLANSSEIIMDKNTDIFYVVSKDANGASPKSMSIGHFTIEQEASDEPMYVTRKDLDAFEERIVSLLSKEKE